MYIEISTAITKEKKCGEVKYNYLKNLVIQKKAEDKEKNSEMASLNPTISITLNVN